MGLFRDLTHKPWLTPGTDDTPAPDADMRAAGAARTAVWFYFAIATVLFGILTAAYVMRQIGHDGTRVHDWVPIPIPRLLWFNTGVLLLSSVAWEWARIGLRHRQLESVKLGLLAGGILAMVFLIGQLTVWQQFADAGYVVSTSPANSFFYLITALHGLHLMGGLFFWGRSTVRVLQGAGADEVRTGVTLCASYWHFLLLVWLAMFALLLSN